MLRLYKIAHGLIKEIKVEGEVLGHHLKEADWIDALEPDDCLLYTSDAADE